MTLAAYVTRRFGRAVLLVAGVIVGLAVLLIAAENFRIVADEEAGAAAALKLTVFQLPAMMGETLPLVLMLAALITFLGLSRTSEMVVIRASGVSGLRVLLWPVIVAALLGAAATLFFNPVVAHSTARAEALRAEITGSEVNVLSLGGGSLWLRQGTEAGQTVIQARRASPDGATLYGVRLHRFDPENRLTARIEAASAHLMQGAWVLRAARRWQLPEAREVLQRPEVLSQLRLPTNLTRAQIMDNFAAPEAVAFWRLPAFIAQLERAGFSARRHRVFLQSELARPALFVAMVLIGAGFSLRHVRFGQTGVMVLFAILAGFALYFFRDIAETLGANGQIPVALAAWAAPAAAIMLALALILHLEDG